jgi:hypothetical protein
MSINVKRKYMHVLFMHAKIIATLVNCMYLKNSHY